MMFFTHAKMCQIIDIPVTININQLLEESLCKNQRLFKCQPFPKPIRRQAIIWTSAGLLSIGPLGKNFSESLAKKQNVSFTKMNLKISSTKGWPFYPGGNKLIIYSL